VAVEDYCAGYVVRAPSAQLLAQCPQQAGLDPSVPSTELLLIYFEDSCVRPALANMGIRKALWPLVSSPSRGPSPRLQPTAHPRTIPSHPLVGIPLAG
jgi:hypothetical protein